MRRARGVSGRVLSGVCITLNALGIRGIDVRPLGRAAMKIQRSRKLTSTRHVPSLKLLLLISYQARPCTRSPLPRCRRPFLYSVRGCGLNVMNLRRRFRPESSTRHDIVRCAACSPLQTLTHSARLDARLSLPILRQPRYGLSVATYLH